MTIISNPRFYEILPPEKGPPERSGSRTANQEDEWFASEEPGERRAGVARMLALLVAGSVAAVVGWQTYGHAARETIAGLSPRLRWVEPEETAHDKIEQITHGKIEQITRSVDQMAGDIAASHEHLTRRIDQLAAGQEQMSREISRLRASGQLTADALRRARHTYYYRW
jgi:methyl-accepting chemotaxis protein